MVDLVEVLLTATAHCKQVEFEDRTIADGTNLVTEARTLLGELVGFRNISRHVAMLRDRADLEVGISLDWGMIDNAFQTVVGDVDAYATSLIRNLDELRAHETDFPEHAANAVLANFTDAEVLRGMGSLYLRRAELRATQEPVADCRKAYAAFLACRILERASSRTESATTSYQRARAIIAAAKATGRVTPFKADLEGKRSLVHLASALFGRAVNLTVGLFHIEVKRFQSEASLLQKSLNN